MLPGISRYSKRCKNLMAPFSILRRDGGKTNLVGPEKDDELP